LGRKVYVIGNNILYRIKIFVFDLDLYYILYIIKIFVFDLDLY